ncbi:ABC transporter permease [Emcibacter nanhaiensis]|uniref:FtsX-like permease family protein n=1 Tax=Emcibacter nanhaiensis TaxID=1505037 RepID=A0A501PCH8_9PROT|nr:ABC transporter permease [Emcibacter nanhaiensis]TPD57925.1 FtsX-like permease family protein [Emcibacter nanhaiensis]
MLKNYIIIALRNLMRNKLYSAINIGGLALGMAIYLFGSVLADYENSHDKFFANSDKIFALGSVVSPTADIGVSQTTGIYSAIGPLIKAELTDVKAVARTLRRQYLMSIDQDSYYQVVRFTDPDFLKIFTLDYIAGDETALEDPNGLLLTESMAMKYFGTTDVLNRVISFDHNVDLHVTAVVRDLPANSHFNASLMDDSKFEVMAPIKALNKLSGYDLEGNWNNLSGGDDTFVLLPQNLSRDWLDAQVQELYQRHASEDTKKFIVSLAVRPLAKMNTVIWDMVGMPAIQAIQLLGFMVLIVACVNYTNLATAQSMGRVREVGLRKTMGATLRQLLVQFLVESLTIASLAMLVALALLEMVIPLFNDSLGKVMGLHYLSILPWLVLTTVLVGLLAGAYPAYVITRTSPVDALRNTMGKGAKGTFFRSLMIGTQFAISIFMLALVAVIFFQNKKVEEGSHIYPKDQVLALQRLQVDDIRSQLDTLRTELNKIPGVEEVAFSNQVPFEQNNSGSEFTPVRGDEATKLGMNIISITPEFFDVYDIPLLTGRALSREVANDTYVEDTEMLNVVVNELALKKLGFSSAQDAIGKSFYRYRGPDSDGIPYACVIVGVVPDQNFLGLHNAIKPIVFRHVEDELRIGSVRMKAGNIPATLRDIEAAWKRVLPDYPIQTQFVDEIFRDVYSIYQGLNAALAGFAIVALMLAMFGLFGLAAFMATQRTKEIGIRKVLGASIRQIVTLLVWQFSRPVVWALLVALPLSYWASGFYLNFFADRIDLPVGIILMAGLVAVIFSWVIVSIHAIRVARANPAKALRYE